MKETFLPFVLSFILASSLVAALTLFNNHDMPPGNYKVDSFIYLKPENKKTFLRIASGGAIEKEDLVAIRGGSREPLDLESEEILASFRGQGIHASDLPGDLSRSAQKKYLQLLLEELWIEAEAEKWQINIPEDQILELSKEFFGKNIASGSKRLRAILLASALYAASGNNLKLIQSKLKQWKKKTNCTEKYPSLCR